METNKQVQKKAKQTKGMYFACVNENNENCYELMNYLLRALTAKYGLFGKVTTRKSKCHKLTLQTSIRINFKIYLIIFFGRMTPRWRTLVLELQEPDILQSLS